MRLSIIFVAKYYIDVKKNLRYAYAARVVNNFYIKHRGKLLEDVFVKMNNILMMRARGALNFIKNIKFKSKALLLLCSVVSNNNRHGDNWKLIILRISLAHSQVEYHRSGAFARAAYRKLQNRKRLELVLHNKYDTLLGISELVYIHILLLDRISRPGHPIVGSIIHCYTQAFYALCALSHNNCNANHRI